MISGIAVDNQRVWGGMYPSVPIGGGFQVLHSAETSSVQALGHYFIHRFPSTGDAHPSTAGEGGLTGAQMFQLEQKFDDLRYNSGTILGDTGNVNACVIIATREYVANGAEPTCMAAFKFN
jgi:hypothetical protein